MKMNYVKCNYTLNYRVIIFILCTVRNINTFKIYSFIHDEIPFFFQSDIQSEICSSDICERDAQDILSSLNKSVDPCQDFYEFACGGWLFKNNRPKSEPVWGRWESIIKKVENDIENILSNRSDNKLLYLNNAQEMYKTCLNADNLETESLLVLSRLLQNFGGWPIIQKDWSFVQFWAVSIAKINAYLNLHPLLNFHVSVDLYNTSQHILYVDHPTFLLPKSFYSDPITYKQHLKAYELFIIDSVLEISSNINSTKLLLKDIKHDAFEIIKFETKLLKIMTWKENPNNLSYLYKRITVKHLQYLTDLGAEKNHNIKVSWLKILNIVLHNANITLSNEDYIVVKDLSYVTKLINLIERTSPRVVANYLGWTIVRHFAKDSTSNMRKYAFAMDKILYGVHDEISRKKYCISTVNKYFGLIIAHAYIEKHFEPAVKNEVEKIIKSFKLVLVSKLKSLGWLDEDTKIKAIEKAKDIGMLVAYPNWLKNISSLQQFYSNLNMTKHHILNIILCYKFKKEKELIKIKSPAVNERWSGLPTDVNAYYNVLKNVIIFPSGILQYPFYHQNRIEALNYGALGTIIGHELSHAFDNTGRQADKNGNLIQWWTEESLLKYQENIKCFSEHYDRYLTELLQKELKQEIMINHHKIQDENIADIIGLDLAYTAFINMKTIQLNEMKLRGLENYTSEQYFFIAYANQWCESVSKEQLMSDIMESDHTPTKIRVLGTLSNSRAFSEVFNCPIGCPMNPVKKCTLW